MNNKKKISNLKCMASFVIPATLRTGRVKHMEDLKSLNET